MSFNPHQILVGWAKQGVRDGQAMWHAWEGAEKFVLGFGGKI
jgi:hypothetical protein